MQPRSTAMTTNLSDLLKLRRVRSVLQLRDGVDQLLDGHELFSVSLELGLGAALASSNLGDLFLLQLERGHEAADAVEHLVDAVVETLGSFRLLQVLSLGLLLGLKLFQLL